MVHRYCKLPVQFCDIFCAISSPETEMSSRVPVSDVSCISSMIIFFYVFSDAVIILHPCFILMAGEDKWKVKLKAKINRIYDGRPGQHDQQYRFWAQDAWATDFQPKVE